MSNASNNAKRLERLEKLLAVSSKNDPMLQPIPPDELAVVESLEDVLREYPDLDFRAALEVAVARGLESRGYTTAQIAEVLPAWIEELEPSNVGGG